MDSIRKWSNSPALTLKGTRGNRAPTGHPSLCAVHCLSPLHSPGSRSLINERQHNQHPAQSPAPILGFATRVRWQRKATRLTLVPLWVLAIGEHEAPLLFLYIECTKYSTLCRTHPLIFMRGPLLAYYGTCASKVSALYGNFCNVRGDGDADCGWSTAIGCAITAPVVP